MSILIISYSSLSLASCFHHSVISITVERVNNNNIKAKQSKAKPNQTNKTKQTRKNIMYTVLNVALSVRYIIRV